MERMEQDYLGKNLEQTKQSTNSALNLSAKSSRKTSDIKSVKDLYEEKYNLVSAKAALHSIRFWQYFSMMLLANIFGGFFSY